MKTQSLISNIFTDNIILDKYLGGAMEWEPNEWLDMSEDKWQRLLKRVGYMNLSLIRCMLACYWYCTGFHEDRPVYVWDNLEIGKDSDGNRCDILGYNIEPNIKRMEKLYKVLEFCNENGIDVIIGEWTYPETGGWIYQPAEHLKGLGLTVSDQRYTGIIGDFLDYMIKVKGFNCIKYYNLGNEVNLNTTKYTYETWSTGIRNLHGELMLRKLQHQIGIVGPDSGYWSDLWLQDTLDDLDGEISLFDYHWYLDGKRIADHNVEDEMRLLVNTVNTGYPRKPVILGEMGIMDGMTGDQQWAVRDYKYGVLMADGLLQCIRAGIAATVAWGLDDCIHINGPIPLDYKVAHNTQTKIWGVCNSLGTEFGVPDDENLRPWYYFWSLLSRFFPRNSQIIYTDDLADRQITCAAAKIEITSKSVTPDLTGYNFTYAAINASDENQTIEVKIPNSKRLTDCKLFLLSEEMFLQQPKEKTEMTVPFTLLQNVDFSNGCRITVPAHGMALLTTLETGKTLELTSNSKKKVEDFLCNCNLMNSYKNIFFNSFDRHPDVVTERYDFKTDLFKHRLRINRSSDDSVGTITYNLESIMDFHIEVYCKNNPSESIEVRVSRDNRVWQKTQVDFSCVADAGSEWFFYKITSTEIPADCKFLKLLILPKGKFDETQICKIIINENL